MDALVAITNLFGLLGFSLVACDVPINVQYIDSLDELSILEDEKIENLCKLVCHPGGMMINPNVGAVGEPLEISAP